MPKHAGSALQEATSLCTPHRSPAGAGHQSEVARPQSGGGASAANAPAVDNVTIATKSPTVFAMSESRGSARLRKDVVPDYDPAVTFAECRVRDAHFETNPPITTQSERQQNEAEDAGERMRRPAELRAGKVRDDKALE